MNNFFNKIVRLFCLCVFLFGHSSADAQNKEFTCRHQSLFRTSRQAACHAQCGWLYSEMVAPGANLYAGQEQCRFY